MEYANQGKSFCAVSLVNLYPSGEALAEQFGALVVQAAANVDSFDA